jgi:hypothetical protein
LKVEDCYWKCCQKDSFGLCMPHPTRCQYPSINCPAQQGTIIATAKEHFIAVMKKSNWELTIKESTEISAHFFKICVSPWTNLVSRPVTLTCLINEHTLINEQAGRIFSFITWKIACRVGKFVIYYIKNCCRVDFFFRNAKRACLFIRQVRVFWPYGLDHIFFYE